MRSKSIKSAMLKMGTRPGSLLYTGEKKIEPVTVELISYDAESCSRKGFDLTGLKDLNKEKINWINITGVHDAKIIEGIGEFFKLDPLTLEDIMTVGGRPKYDKYDDYSYFVISVLSLDDKKLIKQEQVSVVITGNFILTFLEDAGDVFDTIRKRINENKGKVRSGTSAYLFYNLIDTIVDQYFYIMNALEEKIEGLEADIMSSPDNSIAKDIYTVRRELMNIRNAIWPIRDILNDLIESGDIFDKEETRHMKDVNDNIRQIIDLLSSYRDLVMGLYEAYLSNISNKMNRIMTTLTIFSVVFIPLTFLAGVYGMNFKYFPEISFKYSYPAFWVLCVLIALILFIFFKKKKWFV
jgi:magnesium transporter